MSEVDNLLESIEEAWPERREFTVSPDSLIKVEIYYSDGTTVGPQIMEVDIHEFDEVITNANRLEWRELPKSGIICGVILRKPGQEPQSGGTVEHKKVRKGDGFAFKPGDLTFTFESEYA